jgi:hypothetical protein
MILQGTGRDAAGRRQGRPKVLAASLGFTRSRIRTLESGCEFELYFVDNATAEIGLNDDVYRLKKR